MPDSTLRRPLVGLAASTLIGTFAAFALPSPPLLLIVASLALLAAAGAACVLSSRSPSTAAAGPPPGSGRLSRMIRFFHRDLPASLLINAAVLTAAWTAAAISLANRFPDAVFGKEPTAGCELIGLISDDPCLAGFAEGRRSIWRFGLQTESARLPGDAWHASRASIEVRWTSTDNIRPQYGDRWLIRGSLVEVKRRALPAFPALRRYRCDTSASQSQWLSGGHGFALVRWAHAARRRAAAALARGIEAERDVLGLLRGLILGYRQSLPRPIREDFAATGTIHIIAISGLQVGMIAGILIWVLCAFGISRTHWALFLTPVLAAYTVATGLSPSAVRSGVMAVAFYAAPLLGRASDALSALALSAILIVGAQPDQLFDIGFILSFSAVMGLIAIFPELDRLKPPFCQCDPLRLEPESRAIAAGRRILRYGWSLMAASVAAWLATIPITVHFFGNLSVIGLLGNLLAVPFSFLIVFTGCLSLFAGACVPALGEVFNCANLFLVATLFHSIRLLAAVPGSHFTVPSLPWPFAVAWYAVLAFSVHRLNRRKVCMDNTASRS